MFRLVEKISQNYLGGIKLMMNDQLKKDIEAMVAEIFSQKEEADKKVRTEEALQKAAVTIVELTEAVEKKNAQEGEVASKVVELENTITDLNSKLEAAQNEITDSNSKLAESEKNITEMKKDRATELRMKDLVDSGIALANKEIQTTKVREMTDEEFVTYKEELVSLRKAVEEELSKTAQAVDEQAKKEQEEKEKAAAAAKEEEEKKAREAAEANSGVTPPPEVKKQDAARAALNLEIIKKDDILTKYAEMGKAMATRMVNKNK
jgi:chromosome segregation ATPase